MIKVILNVNLEFELPVKTIKAAQKAIINLELPESYISESLEVVKFLDENDNEIEE